MIRLFVWFLVVLVGGVSIINFVPSLKQKVVEIANPSIKEAKVLGELTTTLDQIGSSLTDLQNSKNAKEIGGKIKDTKDLVQKSKELLRQAGELNGNPGLIKSVIGQVIQSVVDRSLFPADHIKTSSENEEQRVIYECPPTDSTSK